MLLPLSLSLVLNPTSSSIYLFTFFSAALPTARKSSLRRFLDSRKRLVALETFVIRVLCSHLENLESLFLFASVCGLMHIFADLLFVLSERVGSPRTRDHQNPHLWESEVMQKV